ncbi:nitrilase-related carbon-nitrogen hydrolase, partial [Actinotalea sp.]|uniref:nitrilase-related carbon-nitrogen hydrolase n=1 Tax=Actinotalea sp. TaxID=1872145 RepID=UPI00356AE940
MPMTIALAQIDARVGDLGRNTTQVLEWCTRAAQAGADLVVLPEMTLTGYPIEDLALRDSFARAADRSLYRLAEELLGRGLGELVVVLGTLGRSPDGRATNRAVT